MDIFGIIDYCISAYNIHFSKIYNVFNLQTFICNVYFSLLQRKSFRMVIGKKYLNQKKTIDDEVFLEFLMYTPRERIRVGAAIVG